jgi:multidrug resistance efflux pump
MKARKMKPPSESLFMNLEQCSQFNQVLATPIPMKMHGTVVVLSFLIVTAVTWSIWTQANVVVRGVGRMRPVANEHGIESVSEELSSEIPGRIKTVLVSEDQKVVQGQLLVEIHTQQIDHQILTVESELVGEQQGLEQLQTRHELLENEFSATIQRTLAEINEARVQRLRELARQESKVASAKAELALEQEKFQRMSQLFQSKAVSQQELSEARTAVTRAEQVFAETGLTIDEQRLQVLQKTLVALEETHKTKLHESENSIREKRDAVARKQLELNGLRRDRLRSQIVAPAAGVVTSCRVSAGDVIQPGPLGITIQPNRDLEMVMTVSAADVGQLRLGMPARIKMDAFDHQTYGTLQGTLRFIAPDSTVDTDTPSQDATYALRVAIENPTLRRDGTLVPMKLGMTGIGEVVVERDSLLSLLLKKVRHTISL